VAHLTVSMAPPILRLLPVAPQKYGMAAWAAIWPPLRTTALNHRGGSVPVLQSGNVTESTGLTVLPKFLMIFSIFLILMQTVPPYPARQKQGRKFPSV
jgi:hypothetical protein